MIFITNTCNKQFCALFSQELKLICGFLRQKEAMRLRNEGNGKWEGVHLTFMPNVPFKRLFFAKIKQFLK